MVSEPSSISSMAASSSASSSLPTSFNISHLFPIPMERNTYLCWRSQFEDILDIHDFKGFISSSTSPPAEKLQDDSINPAFSVWKKTDKLVLSWIKATVSPSIHTLILSCTTSSEAWTLLEKRLSPVSKIHIRTLRDQLRSLKKSSDKSMVEYLLNAKSISDSLTAAGSSISDSDLVECVLDGLGHEYKEFVTSLHLRPSTSFDDLYDLLLQEEHLLSKMTSLNLTSGTALVATNSSKPSMSMNTNASASSFRNFRGRGRGRARPWQSWRPSSDSRPPLLPTPRVRVAVYRPPSPQSSYFTSPSSINTAVACQICN